MRYLLIFLITLSTFAQNQIVGSRSYIHLEQVNGVWWFVDADGEKFISTGMNHINHRIRFADYNKAFWTEQFGEDIISNNSINFRAQSEIKNWMRQIVKDHENYGFNTIAFHRPMYLPDTYFNELGIYFLGKIKMGEIHAGRVKRSQSKFPDVFSEAFKIQAENVARAYCSKHANSKYLIGYTYDDLPSYSFEEYNRKIKYEGHKGGLLFHPWITDIINQDGNSKGKQLWISVLKQHYSSAEAAAKNYNLAINSWEAFQTVSFWEIPSDKAQWQKDQTAMLKYIVSAWHEVNRNAIRKFDSNHLILGDKISCHGKGHPDWVYQVVGNYVDVLLIQDYDFFNPQHLNKLKKLHTLSNKPILNGDHSYSYTVPEMRKAKGIPVANFDEVGEAYYTYLRGVSNLPFMLGWHNCGYMEQWQGSQPDQTGKEQTGFFNPFGLPRTEALEKVKTANTNCTNWHNEAGQNDFVFSKLKRYKYAKK